MNDESTEKYLEATIRQQPRVITFINILMYSLKGIIWELNF